MATATRERILDSALDLFAERGVVATSIEDVCARSGASVGSVYHHFAGKEGLADALVAESLGAYQTAFLTELRRHGEAEDGVRGIVRFHLGWCAKHPGAMRFLFAHGGSAPPEQNRAFFADVMAWWRPHVRYGALRDLPLDLAYALWLGPVQEYCRLWLADRTPVAPRRAASVLADGAWQALKGDSS
jgi:AcrR family transcriptional regulator